MKYWSRRGWKTASRVAGLGQARNAHVQKPDKEVKRQMWRKESGMPQSAKEKRAAAGLVDVLDDIGVEEDETEEADDVDSKESEDDGLDLESDDDPMDHPLFFVLVYCRGPRLIKHCLRCDCKREGNEFGFFIRLGLQLYTPTTQYLLCL